jgi:hypothetical protein
VGKADGYSDPSVFYIGQGWESMASVGASEAAEAPRALIFERE